MIKSHFKLSFNGCGWVVTFFDKLHKHWVVTADSQPKAIFIFLDYYTSLDQTCQSGREDMPIKNVCKKDVTAWKKKKKKPPATADNTGQ